MTAARFLIWSPLSLLWLASTLSGEPKLSPRASICAKGNSICIPDNYSKFDLPNETQTTVSVGIDIKDIPKIDDKDFSVTLNAFFVVRWTDTRLVIDQERIDEILGPEAELADEPEWIPVDVSFIKEFWLPDAEILNLKEFKTLDVLSKLEGLWLNKNSEIMYAVATRITFICPMTFNSFPLDVQVCLFQVGSFNYDNTKMVFVDEFEYEDEAQVRSVLDYAVEIKKLPESQQNYVAITGNYSVAGFELTLRRKVSHYIITCYLPSGMFVIVSWISFLIPPDIVPGRMTLLITVFLVLVNIFNTITTNIPKAEGLTAIEAFVIVCVLFVFGALIEYAGILLQLKVRVSVKKPQPRKINSRRASCEDQVPLTNIQNPSNGTKNLDHECDVPANIATRNQEIDVRRKKPKKAKNYADEKLAVARLDLMFLLVFPFFFLLFNLIYWISFLYIIPDP